VWPGLRVHRRRTDVCGWVYNCRKTTLKKRSYHRNVSLKHKSSLKSLEYICSNGQQYIAWIKIIIFFLLWQKIIRILRSCSMKIFCKLPTVNISKLNFWLAICIAKNFIWTNLKVIFSIFFIFCTLRFQIFR